MQLQMNSSLSDRVYGGENVPYSLLPFLVLIRTIIPPNNVAICTGTLIGTNPSNSYVLTAKHCVDTQVSNYRRSFHLCGQVNPCPGGCGANYGYRNSKRAASNAFGDPEIFFFNDIIAARPSNYNRQLPDIAVKSVGSDIMMSAIDKKNDTANTYDDKVAVIRMIVGDEAGKVSNVFRQLMKKDAL